MEGGSNKIYELVNTQPTIHKIPPTPLWKKEDILMTQL